MKLLIAAARCLRRDVQSFVKGFYRNRGIPLSADCTISECLFYLLSMDGRFFGSVSPATVLDSVDSDLFDRLSRLQPGGSLKGSAGVQEIEYDTAKDFCEDAQVTYEKIQMWLRQERQRNQESLDKPE